MTVFGKQIIVALIGVLALVLLLTTLSIVCKADELQYRIDFENCLYNLLHATDTNDDWDTTKIYQAVNMGITFVEGASKGNEIHDTVSFAPGTSPVDTSIFYALSTDATTGGVLNVLYVDGEHNELIALSRRNPEDFGKDHIGCAEPGAKRTYMFAEFGDTIMVYPAPDVGYVMHVLSYKVSDWLDSDSAEVKLSVFHRLLALEMAYGYAQLMTGTQVGFQRYTTIREEVLTALFGLPPEPESKVQSLGIEGQ